MVQEEAPSINSTQEFRQAITRLINLGNPSLSVEIQKILAKTQDEVAITIAHAISRNPEPPASARMAKIFIKLQVETNILSIQTIIDTLNRLEQKHHRQAQPRQVEKPTPSPVPREQQGDSTQDQLAQIRAEIRESENPPPKKLKWWEKLLGRKPKS